MVVTAVPLFREVQADADNATFGWQVVAQAKALQTRVPLSFTYPAALRLGGCSSLARWLRVVLGALPAPQRKCARATVACQFQRISRAPLIPETESPGLFSPPMA